MSSAAIIKDFTKGPLFWSMVRFSLPFMVSNALQILYAMADMLIVGRYVGSHGLSAVAIASQATLFPTMIALGTTTGGQVYISQLIGGGRQQELSPAIGTLFSMVLLAAAVITAAGLLLAGPFLQLLSTPAEAYADALSYLRITFGGMIFIFGYNMVSAVLRGMGDSRHPFWFILIASVVNVLLDLVFIAGFGWGVAGAGIATVASQGISFLFSMFFLYRNRRAFSFDFRPASWRIRPAAAGILLKLGIPFTCRFAAVNVSVLYVHSLINSLGVCASAAFGIGLRLDDLVNKTSQGVMMAVSTITGQNMAAGEFARVRRGVYYAWSISGSFFFLFGLLVFFYPRELFGFFTGDAEVLKLAPVITLALLTHYPALAIMKGSNGFIQGIGNANLGLVIALMDGLVFRIGLSWLLGIRFGMGLWGFMLGYALATWATAIPTMGYFFLVPWEKRKLLFDRQ